MTDVVWQSMCTAQSEAHVWRWKYDRLVEALEPLLDECERVHKVSGYDLRDFVENVRSAQRLPIVPDQEGEA